MENENKVMPEVANEEVIKKVTSNNVPVDNLCHNCGLAIKESDAICKNCDVQIKSVAQKTNETNADEKKRKRPVLIAIISMLLALLIAFGAYCGYLYYQERKVTELLEDIDYYVATVREATETLEAINTGWTLLGRRARNISNTLIESATKDYNRLNNTYALIMLIDKTENKHVASFKEKFKPLHGVYLMCYENLVVKEKACAEIELFSSLFLPQLTENVQQLKSEIVFSKKMHKLFDGMFSGITYMWNNICQK